MAKFNTDNRHAKIGQQNMADKIDVGQANVNQGGTMTEPGSTNKTTNFNGKVGKANVADTINDASDGGNINTGDGTMNVDQQFGNNGPDELKLAQITEKMFSETPDIDSALYAEIQQAAAQHDALMDELQPESAPAASATPEQEAEFEQETASWFDRLTPVLSKSAEILRKYQPVIAAAGEGFVTATPFGKAIWKAYETWAKMPAE